MKSRVPSVTTLYLFSTLLSTGSTVALGELETAAAALVPEAATAAQTAAAPGLEVHEEAVDTPTQPAAAQPVAMPNPDTVVQPAPAPQGSDAATPASEAEPDTPPSQHASPAAVDAAAPAPESVEKPPAEPLVAAPENKTAPAETESTSTDAAGPRQHTLPPPSFPIAPSQLQSLVDERREQLRKQRRALLDARRAPPAYSSSWRSDHEEAMNRYREATRAFHRMQRDRARLQRDIWWNTQPPWSRSLRDRAALRSYWIQMQQLGRQEQRDQYLYGGRVN